MNRLCSKLAILAPLVLVMGCTQGGEQMQTSEDTPEWEAHQNLFSPEVLGGVEVSLGMNQPASAKQIAASDDFKAKVDAFESSPLPPAWSDRQAEKDEVVQALRDLIAAAEGQGDIQEAYDNVKQANAKLTQSGAAE